MQVAPAVRDPSSTPRIIRITATQQPIALPTEPPTIPPLIADPAPALTPQVLPSSQQPPVATIGVSVEGRPLIAHRFGTLTTDARSLMLIGGIHGGFEANTVTLVEALIEHFAADATAIPAGMQVILIPIANPDGYARGRDAGARFNANGVDLNRNWACEWSRDAYWRSARVNPGVRALSEPETQALAAFLAAERPAAALFYHSAAAGVFAGNCGGDHGSAALSAIYGAAAGYGYGAPFSAYPVTGTAASWADGMRIPSADVELRTRDSAEFDENLAAVMAVLRWLSDEGYNRGQ